MNDSEIKLIKQAIINEIEAYEFYQMAMQTAKGSQTKETLELLSKEEMKHAKWLRDLLDSINDPDAEFKLATIDAPPSPNIYQWNKLDNTVLGHTMTVFKIGIDMERDSIEFYENAMKITTDEKALELYKVLIDWEKTHLEQFLNGYHDMQIEWWAEQNYAPF